MFKLPSRKALEAAFPGKGKELRQVLDCTVTLGTYKSVRDLVRRCLNKPSNDHLLMVALDEILEGHGVEALIPISEHHPSYEYVNMGDIYNVTILLRYDGKIIVSDLGYIVERNMEWYA